MSIEGKVVQTRKYEEKTTSASQVSSMLAEQHYFYAVTALAQKAKLFKPQCKKIRMVFHLFLYRIENFCL
jgi:hypothetical protein